MPVSPPTRPGVRSQRHLVPYVLAYDNTSLFWSLEREKFHANFYVDITDYLQIKLQALRLHASQVREPEFHGSPESLELTSRLRGREISVDSAEGFGALITARPLTPIMATALSILTDGGAYPFRSLLIAVMAPCGHRLVRRITRSEAVTRRPGPDGRQVQAGVEVAWTARMEAFAYRHKGLSAPAVGPIAHLA